MKPQNKQKNNSRGVRGAVSVFGALLGLGVLAYAQPSIPETMPARGILPSAAYSISDLETVNVANGNLLYRIPVASLPKGPAGWSAGVSLIYNSLLWDTVYTTGYSPNALSNGLPSYANYPYEILRNSQDGGWTYGYTYNLEGNSRPNPPSLNFCSDPTQPWKNSRLSVVSPDGSHHTLYIYPNTPSTGSEYYADYQGEGYYDVGVGIQTVTCPAVTAPMANGPVTYYTADGSYIRVVFNNSNSVQPWNIPWTMYFADGRTVTGTGSWAQTMVDKSGNTVTITPTCNISMQLTQTRLSNDWGSTKIEINYGLGASDTVVETPNADGSGTGNLTWTVNYLSGPASTLTGEQYVCTDQNDICPNIYTGASLGFTGISSIDLPDGLSFSFGYDTASGGWGELNSVTLPSGAQVAYTWTESGLQRGNPDHLAEDPVYHKVVTWTDANTSSVRTETTVYCIGYSATGFCTPVNSVTNPDGGVVHYVFSALTTATADLGNQLVSETIHPDGSTDEQIWAQNQPYLASHSTNLFPGNPFVQYQIHSVASSGSPTLATVRNYSVDRNGNSTTATESDWMNYSGITHTTSSLGTIPGFSSSPPAALRTTTDTSNINATSSPGFGTDDTSGYFNPSSSLNAPWGLLATQYVSVSGATSCSGAVSCATFAYGDAYSHPNMTQEQHYDTATSTWLATNYTYDAYGNVATVQDPLGYSTHYGYSSTHDVCLASKVVAYGSLPRTFNYTCTGGWNLIGTSVDYDHSITTTYAYDQYGRETSVEETTGTCGPLVLCRTTATTYNDSTRTVTVKQDLNSNGDGLLQSTTIQDELGRVSETIDPAGNTVTTSYYTPASGSASYILTSNPYTGSQTGWTLTTQDTNGRTTDVQNFSGSGLPTAFGGGNTAVGGTSTSYSSNMTTVVDAVSVTHVNTIDGLGRLWQVQESGISQTTSYCYDTLDDLTAVYQASGVICASPPTAARSFTYSSVKRLLTAVNPETGTITYTYDGDGNLATRVMGGNTTTYCYDPLNELTHKYYGSGSCSGAPVSYTYSYGWRTATSFTGSVNTSTGYSYDGLGRTATSSQTTSSVGYSFSYGWNLADGLTSETYPSGRVISNTFGTSGASTGLLTQVAGALGSLSWTYGSGITYAPHGALAQIAMGNGMTEARTYNSMLETASVAAALGSTNVLNLSYYYYYNGNLYLQYIQRPTLSTPMDIVQSYTYDGVNRVIGVGECTWNGSSCTSYPWSQAFNYDANGNRAVALGSTTFGTTINASWTPTYTLGQPNQFTANNQFIRGSGDVYDSAGNETSVASSLASPNMVSSSMTYDAENRMVSGSFAGTGWVYYAYDADGRRVSSTASGTVFVYDAMGQLAAEYSSTAPTESGTLYMTSDSLGSTRMVTNSFGTPLRCYDFMPFGEEVPNGVGPRGSCYSNGTYPSTIDALSEKFTGKERDAESGLDYFGARYLAGAQGRFTSPDGPFYDQDPRDPQSWNLYSYVRNNPLTSTDPTGQDCQDSGNADPCFTATAHASWLGKLISGIGSFFSSGATGPAAGDADQGYATRGTGNAVALGDIDPSGGKDRISGQTTEIINSLTDAKAIAGVAKVGLTLGPLVLAMAKSTAGERLVIEELVAAGKTVEVIPTGEGRTADFLVDGVPTELKTLRSAGPTTLKNAVQAAAKQGEQVLIDARNVNVSPEEALNQIQRAQGNVGGLQGRVTVLTKGGTVTY